MSDFKNVLIGILLAMLLLWAWYSRQLETRLMEIIKIKYEPIIINQCEQGAE